MSIKSWMLGLALALGAAALSQAQPQMSSQGHCAVGVYRFADEGFVDIAPAGESGLRWRLPDGTTGALAEAPGAGWTSTLGWTGRPDGVRVEVDCARARLQFNGRPATRVPLSVTETRFEVEGATLAGRLLMPEGAGRVPLVVLVHGAERTPARQAYSLQRMFPAAGIAAFVYDKRGTGESTGRYTHDYATLATDAVAAQREARRLAGSRAIRVGYQAGSQGGWVAPLAAHIEPVDFVVVSFGLAVSPAGAEHELLTAELARAGFGAAEIDKALRLSQAVEALVDSNFQTGYAQIEEIRARESREPWFAHARGSIVAPILAMTEEQLRRQGPGIAPSVSLHYDPLPVLQNLTVPQLWLLAADDEVAPAAGTARRLARLIAAGRPISAATFADAEHGMLLYETGANRERLSTRSPAGYFPMMRDFILHGRIARHEGATLLKAAP